MSRFGPVRPISKYTFKDEPTTWFIMGTYPDGRVAIDDVHGTVLDGPFDRDTAEKIIAAHDAVMDFLQECYWESLREQAGRDFDTNSTQPK